MRDDLLFISLQRFVLCLLSAVLGTCIKRQKQELLFLMLTKNRLQIGINNVNINHIYIPNVSAHCIINPYPAISIV
jgi:hypothetical protein